MDTEIARLFSNVTGQPISIQTVGSEHWVKVGIHTVMIPTKAFMLKLATFLLAVGMMSPQDRMADFWMFDEDDPLLTLTTNQFRSIQRQSKAILQKLGR